jgi:hypothetical protein
VVGDVTDRDAVERALEGSCDAVIHAAAVYTLDSRAYPEISRTNLRATETVLDAAARHGCDPVVHVSSFVALLQRQATVTADSPLSSARRGPRRYIVPGYHVDGRSMFNTLQLVTGRWLRHVTLPARVVMLPLTWVATAAQRVLPIHLPAQYEAVLLHTYDTRYDDSPARKEFGLQPLPLVDTYREAVRWLYQAGWLNARQAGDVQNLQTADE